MDEYPDRCSNCGNQILHCVCSVADSSQLENVVVDFCDSGCCLNGCEADD